ncbi:MAG: ion transporter [Candidatus Kaiserbacteria bacterium]|nr:ion transporter [Candidatus Kaiserbacteria bacterium]MCB9816516.1 ion transporter [Candidatus Nomurabacteria bacterium]
MKPFLEKALIRNSSKTYLRTNEFLGIVTIISVLSIALETVSSLTEYQTLFTIIEYVAVAIFTIEFIARLYAKDEKKEYLLSFYGILDIVSIVPTYFGVANLTFLKTARISRLLKFLKLSRVAKLSRISKYANKNSKKVQEVRVISMEIYLIALAIAVMIFASLLYLFEGERNVLFADIPSAVLWVTTVLLGSGVNHADFSTITKLLVVGLQFTSLLLFGLLIAIVGNMVERRLLGSSSVD